MVDLRGYQTEAVASIRTAFSAGRRRVLFVLPTGGGKTVVFSYVTSNAAARGRRVCILVHRQQLVDQVSAALDGMSVRHGVIAANRPETAELVQVASVASLARRLDRTPAFDLIVADEAHHAVAGMWCAVIEAMPSAFLLGVTATPERLDGRGLGDTFDVMVSGPSVGDLTATGFLVPAVVYAPPIALDFSALRTRAGDFASNEAATMMSGATVVGDAIEHYGRLCRGMPGVAFCCSLDHSRLVAERFNAAGFRAAHVDGTTAPDERRNLVAALGSGRLDVLTNAGLISEGVDVPSVGAAILLRPTQSLGLYLQQVGRALRPAPNKDRAIVLDHAGNSARHGLPADVRQWSLEDRPRASRRASDECVTRRCTECGAVSRRAATMCSACGVPLKRTPQEVAEAKAELVRVEQQQVRSALRSMSYRRLIEWADSEDKVRLAASVRGYRRGWIRHRLSEINA